MDDIQYFLVKEQLKSSEDKGLNITTLNEEEEKDKSQPRSLPEILTFSTNGFKKSLARSTSSKHGLSEFYTNESLEDEVEDEGEEDLRELNDDLYYTKDDQRESLSFEAQMEMERRKNEMMQQEFLNSKPLNASVDSSPTKKDNSDFERIIAMSKEERGTWLENNHVIFYGEVISKFSAAHNKLNSPKSKKARGETSPLSNTAAESPLLFGRPVSPVKETSYMKRDFDTETGQKMINEYLILKQVGKGVHGKVKLAYDTKFNDFVAIKIVRKQKAKQKLPSSSLSGNNNSNNDKVKKEIAIMKKCIHPHVVQLFEVINDPKSDKIYMVLEYLDGGDIPWQNESAVTYSIPIDLTKSIFRDLVLGVEYLHYQGIIHRDIKPANILWTKNGIAKISDFGVSTCLIPGSTSSKDAKRKNSETINLNQTAGSPAFFAPELCLSMEELKSLYGEDMSLNSNSPEKMLEVGKAIDIWAMGVTLYCFVFGRIPFQADSEFELLSVIPQQELYFPFEIDADLKDLLERLLDKNPRTRIRMDEIKSHGWLLNEEVGGEWVKPTFELELVHVSDQEVASAYTTLVEKLKRQIRKLSASFQSIRQRSISGSFFSYVPTSGNEIQNSNSPASRERTKSLPLVSIEADDNSQVKTDQKNELSPTEAKVTTSESFGMLRRISSSFQGGGGGGGKSPLMGSRNHSMRPGESPLLGGSGSRGSLLRRLSRQIGGKPPEK